MQSINLALFVVYHVLTILIRGTSHHPIFQPQQSRVKTHIQILIKGQG